MELAGGGWTVVSINGDLGSTNGDCLHLLASDAVSCGFDPAATVDWQLSGANQQKIPFNEMLWVAYDDNLAVPSFAARLVASSASAIGSGNHQVVPLTVPGIPALSVSNGEFYDRKYVEVVDGRTVWGTLTRSTCVGPYDNLGLNLRTDTSGTHDFPGW